MATGQAKTDPLAEQTKLLRDLLIVQMGLAGVPQNNIRAIVGGDVVHVNNIVKLLQRKTRATRRPT